MRPTILTFVRADFHYSTFSLPINSGCPRRTRTWFLTFSISTHDDRRMSKYSKQRVLNISVCHMDSWGVFVYRPVDPSRASLC